MPRHRITKLFFSTLYFFSSISSFAESLLPKNNTLSVSDYQLADTISISIVNLSGRTVTYNTYSADSGNNGLFFPIIPNPAPSMDLQNDGILNVWLSINPEQKQFYNGNIGLTVNDPTYAECQMSIPVNAQLGYGLQFAPSSDATTVSSSGLACSAEKVNDLAVNFILRPYFSQSGPRAFTLVQKTSDDSFTSASLLCDNAYGPPQRGFAVGGKLNTETLAVYKTSLQIYAFNQNELHCHVLVSGLSANKTEIAVTGGTLDIDLSQADHVKIKNTNFTQITGLYNFFGPKFVPVNGSFSVDTNNDILYTENGYPLSRI